MSRSALLDQKSIALASCKTLGNKQAVFCRRSQPFPLKRTSEERSQRALTLPRKKNHRYGFKNPGEHLHSQHKTALRQTLDDAVDACDRCDANSSH